MNRRSFWLLLLPGLAFIAIAVWQIAVSQNDLEIIHLPTTNPPVTIITPKAAEPASRPTVLIAHGFAGSSVLMRGFALTLAHAGYSTVSWDFTGHGLNPNPMNFSSESGQLLKDAESALIEALNTGLINAPRIAILGHSMGSGVALSYGISHPDTSATIAISPVAQPVTSLLPHNLLLMAGSLEAQFAGNAEKLLSQAGGQNVDFSSGSARHLTIITNVEHISILFSPTAQKTARSWLDATFGVQPGATDYTDRRMIWFGLGILGSILAANAGLRLLLQAEKQPITRPSWRNLLTIFVGGMAATVILWVVALSGVQVSQVFGVLVGGYLMLWFGLAGLIGMVIQWLHLSRPDVRELLAGLIGLAALWLGVGLLGNDVWLPWLLIPRRLWLWIPGAIIIFPWFLAIAQATRQARPLARIGWWLFQSITLILSLYLAIILSPALGFIFIILPLVPVIIGIHALVISPRHGQWAYALSGAMFLSWLLLAVFPLQ